jgi:hypothetical protein
VRDLTHDIAAPHSGCRHRRHQPRLRGQRRRCSRQSTGSPHILHPHIQSSALHKSQPPCWPAPGGAKLCAMSRHDYAWSAATQHPPRHPPQRACSCHSLPPHAFPAHMVSEHTSGRRRGGRRAGVGGVCLQRVACCPPERARQHTRTAGHKAPARFSHLEGPAFSLHRRGVACSPLPSSS